MTEKNVECKRVLGGIIDYIKSRDLYLRGVFPMGKSRIDALTYALNLIQEYEELKKAIESVGEELGKAIGSIDYDVDDYELRADEGDYSPNDHEKMLINDYHQGFLDELREALKPILTKYKLRVEELERNNKNQHFLIKGYVEQQEALEKIKEQLQSQLSALRGKVDMGKIIKVMDSLKYKLFYQKPATLSLGEVLFDSDIQKLAQSLVEYFEEGKK